MLKGLTFTRLIIHNYDIDNIDIKESYYFSPPFYNNRTIVHFCSFSKPDPQIGKRISWRVGKTVAGIIVAIVHPLDSLSPVSTTAFNRGERKDRRGSKSPPRALRGIARK